jgi:hypothetical protein
MNKYHSKKTVLGGITFDSGMEASRWQELCLLQRVGQIQELQRQVKFELIPKQNGERAVNYKADFTYTEGGEKIVEDVKGYRTKDYILKRKLFKSRYPEYKFRET